MKLISSAVELALYGALAAGAFFVAWLMASNANGSLWFGALAGVVFLFGVACGGGVIAKVYGLVKAALT